MLVLNESSDVFWSLLTTSMAATFFSKLANCSLEANNYEI